MPYGSWVDSVPGIADPAQLDAWISENVADAGRLTGISLISGGRSNLTYKLDLGRQSLVLGGRPLG
jgi:aminoglycoside phosphotransferase (APT) family kinase protein